MPEPLTARQLAILVLIEEGARDWGEIAEDLELSEAFVRREVQRLCARYDCPMGDLPAQVEAAA